MSETTSAIRLQNLLPAVVTVGAIGIYLIASIARAENPQAAGGEKQVTDPRPAVPRATVDEHAIRRFRVNIPEEAITELRRRIQETRWPDREKVKDESQGVQFATMQKLARYWATEYDWRKCEAKLNALPQFVTEIDGLDIYFIHVRSKHENALPMIVTHGWPGSIIEQLKIIDPLTNPTAHGGSAADAFDLVIPSLPGYGFSGKPTATGWDPVRIARAWIALMKRLGYTKFVAQGGDWGDSVTEQMALLAPPELLAIHTNMPATVPAEIAKALKDGGPPPSGLSADERHAYDQLDFFNKHGLGYAIEMSNRPQTLYGIADSPVGLAAWILDHDASSYALMARVFDGQTEGLTRDDILDNITLYWLTNTAISSARLYWENKLAFFDVKNVTIPVAVSVFPDEIFASPRSWAERAFPKLIHFNKLEKGCHFAAWEQPELFTSEVKTAFRSLRDRPATADLPASRPSASGNMTPADRAVAPAAVEPPAKIIVDPPLPDELAQGHVVIPYRTENLRVMPVFGPAAAAVSPRIGHIHVTLDDEHWVWAETSGQELVIGGLPPGPHKITMLAVNANHKPLTKGVVKFEVPRRSGTQADTKKGEVMYAPVSSAKLIIDAPNPEPLSRGVIYIEYRTENLRIMPVFGLAALGISPRIGHLHLTVDDAPWHWSNASGGPVIVDGLSAGPHKILFELMDANHKLLTKEVVKVEVPRR